MAKVLQSNVQPSCYCLHKPVSPQYLGLYTYIHVYTYILGTGVYTDTYTPTPTRKPVWGLYIYMYTQGPDWYKLTIAYTIGHIL